MVNADRMQLNRSPSSSSTSRAGACSSAVFFVRQIDGVEVDAGPRRDDGDGVEVGDRCGAAPLVDQLHRRMSIAEGSTAKVIAVRVLSENESCATADFEQVYRRAVDACGDGGQAEPQSDRSLHVIGLHKSGLQQAPDLVGVFVRERCQQRRTSVRGRQRRLAS